MLDIDSSVDFKKSFIPYKQFRILYVEDENDLRNITALTLELIFSEVNRFENGQLALEYYKNNPKKIDLVITDISMPVMDGLSLSRHIKKLDPTVPIIITSAHNENSFLHDSINIGINGYLLKPLNLSELIKTISKVLEPKLLQIQLKEKELENQERMLKSAKFLAIGQLAAGLTHELNTPLTYLKGSVEIMEYLLDDLENITVKSSLIKQHIRIKDGINRLINIVESMKEMSKTSSEVPQLSNVYETVVVAAVMAYNRAKHISKIVINDELFNIDMDKHKKLFNAYIHKQRIEQVWIIIINNALDELVKIPNYNDRELYIDIIDEDKYITVYFRDNAGGIKEEIMDSLFEPFKSTKESSGVGVGLSIAKKIIDEQNAKIEAYNQNNGAVFKIQLPKELVV